MKTLDCRDRQCPYPVIEARKLLMSGAGEPFTVLVGDDIARENVTRMASSLGYAAEATETEGGFALLLTPATQSSDEEPAAIVSGKTVAFITADTMGSGSDELGRLLLKNFLFTLTELQRVPDILLFVNAGVKLAAQDSEALEALDKLACMGTDIASCGLCLDYYELKEKLAVGRVTNMLDIAETLQNAGRIIRP